MCLVRVCLFVAIPTARCHCLLHMVWCLPRTVVLHPFGNVYPKAEVSDVVPVELTQPHGQAAMVFFAARVGVPFEALQVGSFFDPESGQQNIA